MSNLYPQSPSSADWVKLTVFASGAAMAEDKPLRIGIEASYPPFAYKTPDGKLAGFDYDIGNVLCEEMKGHLEKPLPPRL